MVSYSVHNRDHAENHGKRDSQKVVIMNDAF